VLATCGFRFSSEVPVWKSTYRILLTDNVKGSGAGSSNKVDTATLQGFSVVDNTTGEDWKNVQLSLIAGSPQSFLQPWRSRFMRGVLRFDYAECAAYSADDASAVELADSTTAVAGCRKLAATRNQTRAARSSSPPRRIVNHREPAASLYQPCSMNRATALHVIRKKNAIGRLPHRHLREKRNPQVASTGTRSVKRK